MTYKRIVVGTDLSKTAELAVERAAWLAEALGAELTLVHAGSDEAGVRAQAEPLGAETAVRSGAPADVLIAEAEERDADLLVVGSVGMSGARRFMLGNVPNKISHHSPTDLLIVKTDRRGAAVGPWRKVLVGTDGSPTATRAVVDIANLSSRVDAETTIVCVYQPPTEDELEHLRADPNSAIAQWSADPTSRNTPDEFRWRIAAASQAEDVLERASDRAAQAGIKAEVRAVKGHPAETLVSLAEDEGFDMIAVGSVGMTGPKRFMLGNVPHRISHHAPTDVLILQTQ